MSEIRTIDADGWSLHLYPHPAEQPWASAILVHAMMADAGYLHTLATELAGAGIECWRVDLRGHGASGPHADAGDWSFDDLVEKDYPAIAAWARNHVQGRPLWLVGHSLGGLAGIAHHARHGHLFDGIVAISSGVWGFEPNSFTYWQRRTLMTLAGWIVRMVGRFPSRWWGNSTDEAATYWAQLVGWTKHRCWRARDGFNYHQAAEKVAVPCIGIRGSRDRLVQLSDHTELLRMPQAEFHSVADRGHMSTVRDAGKPIIEAIRRHTSP